MKALDILLAYGKLPLDEQDKVGAILMNSQAMRNALAQAQKHLSDAVSQDDSEPSNVINVPFGSSKGPSDLVRDFLKQYPHGSCRECKEYAERFNPSVKLGSVTVMFYKLRGRRAA